LNASNALSSSYAATSSFANDLTVAGTITAQKLNVQQVTSSVVYSSGSNVFGNSLSNTQVMTGSVSITGSLSVNGVTNTVGTGTTNTLPKFTSTNTIGNSAITDDGTTVTLVSRALSGTSATFSSNGSIFGTNSASGTGLRVQAGNGASTMQLYGRDNTGIDDNVLFFYKYDQTTLQGGFYARSNILSIRDATNTDVLSVIAGNVGIGTTSPANLLHLTGASATPSLRLGSISLNFYWDIGRENLTTGDFVFNNASGGASTERMRITSGGNVGIGTTSPVGTLHISAASPIFNFDDTSTTGTLKRFRLLSGDIGTTQTALFSFSNSDTDSTGNSTVMVLNELGNVGIGTTSPAAYSGFTNLALNNATNGGVLDFMIGGVRTHTIVGQTTSLLIRTETSLPLIFGTNATEFMRITSGGNVGMGTTSPSGKLSVTDSVYGEYLRIASGLIGGGQSSVYLAWNNAGNITLQQVTVGAVDSGGAGFRLLRIPNT
jgi:hypothetical protein